MDCSLWKRALKGDGHEFSVIDPLDDGPAISVEHDLPSSFALQPDLGELRLLRRMRREAFELLEPVEHDPEFEGPLLRSRSQREKPSTIG